LDGGPEDPADVGAVLETKRAAGSAVRDAFCHFESDVVEEVHVLHVVDDESILWLEAQGDKVQGVLIGPVLSFRKGGFVVYDEFLVVGDLEI
jgi:hypothetical protein